MKELSGRVEEKIIKTVDLIIDLQYGSTGKGLLAGWLAHHKGHDTIMTAWGPNAGHTNIDYEGRKYIHTMLANGIVGHAVQRVMVGPGSVLNLDNLLAEIQACDDVLRAKRITVYIHGHAAVVTEADRQAEATSMTAIGSTKKGVGAAMIRKIQRDPVQAVVARDFWEHPLFSSEHVALVKSPEEWSAIYDMSLKTLIEGAQGFGLSMSHGFYPYTTSRDVTPMQILADVGMPFVAGRRAKVWGTARTFPIRVSNRHDATGKQVGWSGPHYDDQIELDWMRDLHMEAELTTVTKLPRRIFSYSHQQIAFATEMCDPGALFLNFVNYLRRFGDFERIYNSLASVGTRDLYYGVGPTMADILPSLGRGAENDWKMIQNALADRKDKVQ